MRLSSSTRLLASSLIFGAALGMAGPTRNAQAAGAAEPTPVESSFNLSDLVGPWYEIARIGTVKNALCGDATATFALTDKSPNEIEATYARDCPIGGLASISATVKSTDAETPARLSITYREDLGRDHFINVISEDAEKNWIVLGSDDREELYIYSRTPALNSLVLTKLVALADAEWGFDGVQSKMSCTPQSTALAPAGGSCIDVIGR